MLGGQRSSCDRGAVTTFATVFTAAVLFVFALVYEGGQKLAAQRQVDNEAAAAARSGAQAIDPDAVRAGEPASGVDLAEAERRVCAYLAVARGAPCDPGSFDVWLVGEEQGDDEPRGVAVSISYEVQMPMLLGFSRTVTGEAAACNELGVTNVVEAC